MINLVLCRSFAPRLRLGSSTARIFWRQDHDSTIHHTDFEVSICLPCTGMHVLASSLHSGFLAPNTCGESIPSIILSGASTDFGDIQAHSDRSDGRSPSEETKEIERTSLSLRSSTAPIILKSPSSPRAQQRRDATRRDVCEGFAGRRESEIAATVTIAK